MRAPLPRRAFYSNSHPDARIGLLVKVIQVVILACVMTRSA